MSSGIGGALYISQLGWQPVRPVSVLERRQVELELQLARQQVQLEQPCCPPRNSLCFSLTF